MASAIDWLRERPCTRVDPLVPRCSREGRPPGTPPRARMLMRVLVCQNHVKYKYKLVYISRPRDAGSANRVLGVTVVGRCPCVRAFVRARAAAAVTTASVFMPLRTFLRQTARAVVRETMQTFEYRSACGANPIFRFESSPSSKLQLLDLFRSLRDPQHVSVATRGSPRSFAYLQCAARSGPRLRAT
jgi:hypothetical protein